jgi:alpha-tubulin suppressor-like RCC1 family protein
MGQPDTVLAPDADALLPIQIPGGSDWIDADAGQGHACGIRKPGRLFCWGRNTTAELGQGSTMPAQLRTPTRVADAEDWLTVSTGQDFTCGLRAPGSLHCFGDNSEGQLGVGDRAVHDSPTRTGTDEDWTAIDIDTFHGCGIRKPGTLWCWGRNAEGQLGTGTFTDEPPAPGAAHDAPVRVGTDSDWVQISTGRFHTCGRRVDGSLWCTGANDDGRLGTGDSKRRNVMTRVVLPPASSG